MKRTIVVVAVAALIASLGAVTGPARAAEWWDDRGGGADLPPTVLWDGDAGVSGIKDAAIVRMSKYGFVYIAGQQDSQLRVRYNRRRNKLVFRDLGTERVKGMYRTCRQGRVEPGIVIACRVPTRFRDAMFVQIWPRLGDDHIDGRGMPAHYRMWVLADAGDDTVLTSGGDDFVNGAKGRDVVESGDGNDWVRGGPGVDVLDVGAGNDKAVGDDGRDRLYGGAGEDKLYGGRGRDRLYGGPGEDLLSPGPGRRIPDDEI